MSNDWFFEKFALISDAPGAVERMRALVLELAVQGRVVEQDNTEGSSLTLLKEIRKKNTAPNEEISMEQVEFQSVKVPSSWEICGLGEVAEIVRGVSFPGSAKSDSPRDGHVACLRTASVQSEIDWDDLIYIPQSHVRRMDQWVAKNDIMISMANSYELVGKVAIVRSCPKKASFGAFLAAIRPIVIDPYYLLYVLRSPRMQFAFRASSSQTTNIANISLARMRPLPFPLPPLAEQRRVVAKVDELMGICDALEAQQRERESRKSVLVRASLSRFAESPTPENLGYLFHKSYDIPPSELRKSILTLAVQGKLVPQDPNDEPAENIVRRSEIERHRSTAEEGGIQLRDVEFPWKLPLSWKWVRLGVLANIKHGYAFSSESFTSEPTQYVLTTPGSFYESGGFRNRGANTKYFNGQVPLAYVFKAGDLIIPMTEQAAGLLGSPAFIPDDGKTYLHNQRIGKLEFYSDEVAPTFASCFFNHEFFRDQLAKTCTGMKVRHTSPKRILIVPFALPPLAEQRRIVAKVDQLMALVDELERQQESSREKASKLLDAIVQEMTSGERGIAATMET